MATVPASFIPDRPRSFIPDPPEFKARIPGTELTGLPPAAGAQPSIPEPHRPLPLPGALSGFVPPVARPVPAPTPYGARPPVPAEPPPPIESPPIPTTLRGVEQTGLPGVQPYVPPPETIQRRYHPLQAHAAIATGIGETVGKFAKTGAAAEEALATGRALTPEELQTAYEAATTSVIAPVTEVENIVPPGTPGFLGAVGGAEKGLKEFAAGMATPANLAIIAGMIGLANPTGAALVAIRDLLTAGFTVELFKHAAVNTPGFVAALSRGDVEEAGRLAAHIFLSAKLGKSAGLHLARGPVRPAVPPPQLRTAPARLTPEGQVEPLPGPPPTFQEAQAARRAGAPLEGEPPPVPPRIIEPQRGQFQVEVPRPPELEPTVAARAGEISQARIGRPYEELPPWARQVFEAEAERRPPAEPPPPPPSFQPEPLVEIPKSARESAALMPKPTAAEAARLFEQEVPHALEPRAPEPPVVLRPTGRVEVPERPTWQEAQVERRAERPVSLEAVAEETVARRPPYVRPIGPVAKRAKAAVGRLLKEERGEEPVSDLDRSIFDVLDIALRTGGATYNLASKRNLFGERMFAVSPFKQLERITEGPPTAESIRDYIQIPEVAEKLGDPSGRYSLGLWTEQPANRTYHDVTVTTPSRLEAMEIGRTTKPEPQKAIFDLAKGEEIPIEPALKLYHWGRKPGLETLEPSFYGTAAAGAERRYVGKGLERTYYLERPEPVEKEFFGPGRPSPHLYEAEVPPERVYDLKTDPEGIVKRFAPDQTKIETEIRKAGYIGYRGAYPSGEPAYAVFEPLRATFLDRLETDANGALRSLAERAKQAGKQVQQFIAEERGSEPIKENIADIGKWGAAKFARGVLTHGAWTAEMLKEFGDGIKPRLNQIWKRSQWYFDRQTKQLGVEMPKTAELLRRYEQGIEGKHWWDESRIEIRKLFGRDADLFSKILASLSPLKPVAQNLELALKVYSRYKTGRSFSDLGLMPNNIGMLRRIQAGDINFAPFGPKVTSMYRNLMGDNSAVTIDRWIARAFGYEEAQVGGSPALYNFIDYNITQLARKQGVSPAEFQARLWTGMKDAAIEAGEKNWSSESFGVLLRRWLAEKQPDLMEAIKTYRAPSPRAPGWRDFFTDELGTLNLTELRKGIHERRLDLERNFIDRFVDLNLLGEDVTRAVALFAGRGRAVGQWLIEYGKILRPLWKEKLRDAVVEYGLYERYLELSDPRRDTPVTRFPGGLTLGQIQARKAALEARLAPEKLARVKQGLQQIYAFEDRILQQLVKFDILSEAQYRGIKARGERYLPLQRLAYLSEADLNNLSLGSSLFSVSKQNIIYRIGEGSEKEIRNPLESIISNLSKSITLAWRNRVALRVADKSADPNLSGVIIPLFERLPNGHIRKILPPFGYGKFSCFRNGVKEEYAAPKPITDALHGLTTKEVDIVTRLAAKSGAWLRAGATTLNIAFIVPNALRDFQTAMVCSRVGFTPLDWFRGFVSVLGKDKYYDACMREGGGFSGFMEQFSARDIPGTVAELSGQVGLKKVAGIVNPLEWIRKAGEVIELTPRVGIARRAIRKGYTAEEAAFFARRGTVDFARSGSILKNVNMWVPFLNARMQGTVNVFSAIKNRPAASAAIMATMVGIPIVSTYLHNVTFFPEVWKDIRQFEKDQYFMLIYGDKKDEEGNPIEVLKIPKGDVGRIFGNPIESFLEWVGKRDPKSLSEIALQTGSDISPISFEREGKPSGRAIGSTLLPPLAKAGVQAMVGESLWTGRPISKYPRAEPREQWGLRTPKSMVAIGRFLGISPDQLYEFLGTAFGGAARQAAEIGGPVGEETVTRPSGPLGAVKRRFVGAYGGQQESKQRQALKEAEQVSTTTSAQADRTAELLFLRLKKAAPGKARLDVLRAHANQLSEDVLRRLVDKIRPEAAGRTGLDEAIRRSSAHGRAVYFARTLHKTPASERYQLLSDWAEKGLLTADTLTHLKKELMIKPLQ